MKNRLEIVKIRKSKINNLLSKSLVLIAPTFNQYLATRKLILSLKKQTLVPDIVVVDNSSTDNTFQKLSKEFDDITTILTKKNYGSAGGQYIGQKYAYNLGYNNIILTDNDAYPVEKDVIEQLLLKSSENCVVNPINMSEGDVNNYSILHFCLIKRSIIKKCGFIDYKLFLYGDDTEYQIRLHKKGIPLIKINRHYIHPMKYYFNPDKNYYIFRNTLYIIKKHGVTSLLFSVVAHAAYYKIYDYPNYQALLNAKEDIKKGLWSSYKTNSISNMQVLEEDKYSFNKKIHKTFIMQRSERIEKMLYNKKLKQISTGYDFLTVLSNSREALVTNSIFFVPFYKKTYFIVNCNDKLVQYFIVKSEISNALNYLLRIFIEFFTTCLFIIKMKK